jgi:hypothetical protein
VWVRECVGNAGSPFRRGRQVSSVNPILSLPP